MPRPVGLVSLSSCSPPRLSVCRTYRRYNPRRSEPARARARAGMPTTSPTSAAATRRATPSASPGRPGTCRTTTRRRSAPTRCPTPWSWRAASASPTPRQWFKVRRPEILKFYRNEIYGRVPADAPKVTWEVAETDANARDGTAIMKRVVGRMGDKPDGPRMNLTVHLPARASGPVPMLLSITFGFGAGARGQAAGKAAQGQPPGEVRRHERPAATTRRRPRRLRFRGRGPRPRLGIRLAGLHRHPAGPGRSVDGRRHRAHLEGRPDAARPRRMGHHQRLGLGHQPGDRLPRDRSVRRRQADRHHGRLAAGQDRPLGRRPGPSAWPPCSRSSPARWARR